MAFYSDTFGGGADSDIDGRVNDGGTYSKLTHARFTPNGVGQLDIDASGFLREESVKMTFYEITGRTITNNIQDYYIDLTPTSGTVPIFTAVIGFLVGYIDDDNFLYARFTANSGTVCNANATEFVSGSGSTNNITSQNFSNTYTNGVTQRFRVKVDYENKTLEWFVDGVSKETATFSGEYEDVGATMGIVGQSLKTAGPFNTAHADNFEVRGSSTLQLPEPPASWDADIFWPDGDDASPFTPADVTLEGPAGGGGSGGGKRIIGG
jgi:hypothetical protein